MQRKQLRADQTAILWASLASVSIWFLPVVNIISLPLEYLNAHTHEMCHAITAILTGGRVDHIDVFKDGSGVTPMWGGMVPVIGSAGYVGASIIGVMIILFSRTPEGARTSMRLLGAALTGSMLLWVRGDAVGVVSGIAWIALLFTAASLLPPKGALFSATFIGVQQCLHSVLALMTLTNIAFFTKEQNDAVIVQSATGIPAILWALGWMAFSLLLMAITLKGAWKE